MIKSQAQLSFPRRQIVFFHLGYGDPKLSTLLQLDHTLPKGRDSTCIAGFCFPNTWRELCMFLLIHWLTGWGAWDPGNSAEAPVPRNAFPVLEE